MSVSFDRSDDTDPRRALAARLRGHGRPLEGRLYGYLLMRLADDVEAGGPTYDVLGPAAGPPGSVPGLRLLGATHRLALTGEAPALAAVLPTTGGPGEPAAVWGEVHELLRCAPELVSRHVDRPVQTNEPGRAGALVGGLHLAARGLPVRLLELGTSAGLLLQLDRYSYDVGGVTWGDPSSPVRFGDEVFRGPSRPQLRARLHVAERRGCDRNPLDPRSADDRLTLHSYVWADDLPRFERLTAALDVARAHAPSDVDRADAADWVEEQLSRRHDGVATVVMHSVVLQYLDAETQERLRGTIGAAGASASSAAPLAWLRYEPEDDDFVVRLTTWPGADERPLATAHPHGTWIHWSA